jgi:serine/threonine protein kinase
LDRDVAVKVLRFTLNDGDFRARFESERRFAGSLDHRNIVRVYDGGEHDGMPFVAMEYVDGDSLHQLLLRHRRFPVPRVLDLLTQVCAGLTCAHTKGLVHRDIKPANLILGADQVLRILDFGVARMTDATKAFTIVGTPGYMAPEQLAATQVDARTDVYATGVVMYQLLTGQTPTADIQAFGFARALAEILPDIDPAIVAIVERAVQPAPADRFQTAAEMKLALEVVVPAPATILAGAGQAGAIPASTLAHPDTVPIEPVPAHNFNTPRDLSEDRGYTDMSTFQAPTPLQWSHPSSQEEETGLHSAVLPFRVVIALGVIATLVGIALWSLW